MSRKSLRSPEALLEWLGDGPTRRAYLFQFGADVVYFKDKFHPNGWPALGAVVSAGVAECRPDPDRVAPERRVRLGFAPAVGGYLKTQHREGQ